MVIHQVYLAASIRLKRSGIFDSILSKHFRYVMVNSKTRRVKKDETVQMFPDQLQALSINHTSLVKVLLIKKSLLEKL